MKLKVGNLKFEKVGSEKYLNGDNEILNQSLKEFEMDVISRPDGIICEIYGLAVVVPNGKYCNIGTFADVNVGT